MNAVWPIESEDKKMVLHIMNEQDQRVQRFVDVCPAQIDDSSSKQSIQT